MARNKNPLEIVVSRALFFIPLSQLGAGPGIALVMSLLVVIGTLLPLIEDHADNADSPAALVTMLGLVFAISGFVTSGTKRGTTHGSTSKPAKTSRRLESLSRQRTCTPRQ